MNKNTSLILFIVGLFVLLFGVLSANSFSSNVSMLTNTPTERSIWLLTVGVLITLIGASNFIGRSHH